MPMPFVWGVLITTRKPTFRESERRDEAFESLREKELQRVAESKAQSENDLSESDEDESEEEDDADDDEYRPGSFGHERKRAKTIQLQFDVDALRESHSAIADRRIMSSRARTDDLSNFVVQGGGDLYDVPCSQTSTIRFKRHSKMTHLLI